MASEARDRGAAATATTPLPMQPATIRDPIEPHPGLTSPMSNLGSYHRSPRSEELNHALAGSLQSSASTSAAVAFGASLHTHMTGGKGQGSAARHGRTAQTWNNSSNPANPKTQSPPQPPSGLCPTPLSPTPLGAGASKAVAGLYTPLRLDSQLLASPWPGVVYSASAQQLPSPTRAAGISATLPQVSYWNAGASPLPYPCGSPTTFHGAGHILSPSAHSLRFVQSQPPNANDGASPVQTSFSNLGRETSFLTASTSVASPMTAAVGHSAILDAPLQLSLVPPPYRDERPLFSFGSSIMQSSPYIPTRASASSRRRSIYHDAMMDLAQTRGEAGNPLTATPFGAAAFRAGAAAFSAPAAMSRTASGRATSVGGHEPVVERHNAISNSSLSQANGARTLSNANLYNSAGSEDASVGNTDIVIGMGSVDWHRLDRPSPSNVSLMEQAASQRSEQASAPPSGRAAYPDKDTGMGYVKDVETEDDDEEEGEEDEEEQDMDALRRTRNSTPEALASTGRGSQAPSAGVSAVPTSSATEEPELLSQPEGDAARPLALDQTARPDGGNTGLLSLSVSTLAYSDVALRNSATTPTASAPAAASPAAATAAEASRCSPATDIVTPLVSVPLRESTRPLTPAAAASAGVAVPDFHLFMPSPVDQGVHVFGGLRDSAVRASPSEQSTSTLSLVPTAMGLWQVSPLVASAWQSSNQTPTTSLSTAHTLQDLLEVLRLLQSDIDNVYSKVSVSEHVVRRWVSGTLGLLLQLATELRHSAALAAAVPNASSSSATLNSHEASTSESQAVYAQLRDDLAAAAASCGAALQATADAIQRDQENLEPLLLTAILGRSATAALLSRLEKPYVTSRAASHVTSTSTNNVITTRPGAAVVAVAGATTSLNGSALRHASATVPPAVSTLTPERIEELMDSKTLREELDVHWPPFASAYNKEVLRYLCLRAVYVQWSSSAEHPSRRTSGDAAAAPSVAVPLSSLVTDWVDAQLTHWDEQQEREKLREQAHSDAKHATVMPDSDGGDAATALREGLCGSLPSFEQTAEALSSFRDGEGWRWWYTLLNNAMSCTFHIRENAGLYSYVEGQLAVPSDAAAAALHDAIARRTVAVEEVEVQLQEVEQQLFAMEERGKALRVEVLQCLLRRIFVLTVVASVHRAAGKDAPVSGAQLAAYVQLQRKSLEDAEAQLSAHHAECSGHLRHLHAFLALFPSAATTSVPPTASAADRTTIASTLRAFLAQRSSPTGAPPTVALDVSSEDMAQQWSSPMVTSLVALLARPHSETELMERSESSGTAAEYSEREQARAAASLVRDVSARLVSTIQSLCVLLQSDVDAAEAHASYFTSPVMPSSPSTRALRRLQASLAEAHHATCMCLASLRLGE